MTGTDDTEPLAFEAAPTSDLEPPAAPAPEASALFTAPAGPLASGAPLTDATAAASTAPGPRIRWAAIVWGLVLAATAGWAVWVLLEAERRDAVTGWFSSLSLGAAVAYGVLALGLVALVIGLAGVARRIQRAIAARA